MRYASNNNQQDLPLSFDAMQRLLTSEQVAEILNVSPRTLWTLTNSGEIQSVRIGRSVRYSTRDVDAFINFRRGDQTIPQQHSTTEAA